MSDTLLPLDPVGTGYVPHPTSGVLRYLVPSEATPVYYASQGGGDAELQMEGLFEERAVEIADGRALDDECSLDREGFLLASHKTAVADFYDRVDVTTTYEPEVKRLVMAATGAVRVVVFDHTWRGGEAAVREKRQSREPTNVVHNDYTETSGPQRVRDLMGDEADGLLENRFAVVNVWRPVKGPVLTWPLTLCDARSLAAGDLVASERRAEDRVGELTLVRYNPEHRWVYFPAMAWDEALLIKTFDSDASGRARWSIHTAFEDPSSPPRAAPRESIETRCFAFFG
jgi:hypothetical protein